MATISTATDTEGDDPVSATLSDPPLRLSPPPPPHPSLASLLSLPPELHLLILSSLPLSSLPPTALVSRALNPPSSALLYRSLSLRSHRHGQSAPALSSPLDERSTALLVTLRARPHLAKKARTLEFDTISHLGADEIAKVLGDVMRLCQGLTGLKLGAGAHGHGIGFRPLRDALRATTQTGVGVGLRSLNVEDCAGAPHTLAAVVLLLPSLEDLRVGQFLLEEGDVSPSSLLPSCRLRTLVAQKGRMTPLALRFLTAASGESLTTASLPICELGGALDFSTLVALRDLTLFVFLASSSLAPTATATTSSAEPDRSLLRLSRNFSHALRSLPPSSSTTLSSLTLLGTWDSPSSAVSSSSPFFFTAGSHSSLSSSLSSSSAACSAGNGGGTGLGAGQPVDLVLHARLLHCLPRRRGGGPALGGLLRVRTELNALALEGWLRDEEYWRGGEAGSTATLTPSQKGEERDATRTFRLELWQKQSYSGVRREFQQRVRERVEEAAAAVSSAGGGKVEVEWRRYEKW